LLKKILDRLRNGNRDVYILMLGTIVSQGVPMLAYLALARLYTKEDFGLFGVYFSISMIGTVFMTLRYEMAIMLPESKEDARHLTVLSCLISGAFSLLTLLLVVLFRHQLSEAMHEPRLANVLFLLPFTLLVIGVYQALNYWSNRMAQYKRLAFSRMARAVNSSGLGIVFGFFAFFKSTGMIIGDTIGQAIAPCFWVGASCATSRDCSATSIATS
jgi:O-antigen/teichoic acid export membrane protein